MTFSLSHGLLVLSESNCRLIAPKKILKSNTVITADSQYVLDNDFDFSELEESAFSRALIKLDKEWSECFAKEACKVKQWRVLLPEHWFSFTNAELPHIGSDYLLSLSSLSIISETIRLAPEQLCYGYQSVNNQSNSFNIYGCPRDWLNQLTDICGVEIVSISPYSLAANYAVEEVGALPELEPYQPLKWWFQKQKRLAIQLVYLSVLIGGIGLSILYWVNSRQDLLSQSIQHVQSQYFPLKTPSNKQLQFEALLLALVEVPPQIRVNSLTYSQGELVLNIHASEKALQDFLHTWQTRWGTFVWSAFDSGVQGESHLGMLLEQRNGEIGREVIHANVLVKAR